MSVIADSKKNWLEQVKDDAEKVTLERLNKELPKLNAIAEKMDEQSAPQKAKKEGK